MAQLKTQITDLVVRIDKHLDDINKIMETAGPASYPITEAVNKLIEAKFWLMSSMDIINRMEITNESNKEKTN